MRRVLVVDDDRRMRRTLQIVVEHMGLESVAVADAAEARAQLGAMHFDLSAPPGTYDVTINGEMGATGTGTGGARVKLGSANGLVVDAYGSSTAPFHTNVTLTIPVTVGQSGIVNVINYAPSIGVSGHGNSGHAVGNFGFTVSPR
jgi:hypothetical protein